MKKISIMAFIIMLFVSCGGGGSSAAGSGSGAPVLVLLLVEVFPDKLIQFNHNNFLGYENE